MTMAADVAMRSIDCAHSHLHQMSVNQWKITCTLLRGKFANWSIALLHTVVLEKDHNSWCYFNK